MINTAKGKRTIGECVLLFFSFEGVNESWEEKVLNGPPRSQIYFRGNKTRTGTCSSYEVLCMYQVR